MGRCVEVHAPSVVSFTLLSMHWSTLKSSTGDNAGKSQTQGGKPTGMLVYGIPTYSTRTP